MSRGRDLTKTLDPKEISRLRTLLGDHPEIQESPEAGSDYPMMLFAPAFYETQIAFRTTSDPLQKKKAADEMSQLCRIAFDVDEAEELLDEGWKYSPADHLDPAKDPRIPRGREARKAAEAKRLSVGQELRLLRRRLAELEAMEAGAAGDIQDPAEPEARSIPISRNKRRPVEDPSARNRRTAPVEAHA